jgi:hypothetical protein
MIRTFVSLRNASAEVLSAEVSKLTETIAKPVSGRLIDAGERLFAEYGWNGVGIRTIAAAADVSLAALNYHFGDKKTCSLRYSLNAPARLRPSGSGCWPKFRRAVPPRWRA